MTKKSKKPRRKRGSVVGEKYTSCPNIGTPYLVGDFPTDKKRAIIKARCKLWDCPYCAYVNKSEHFNRMVSGIQKLSDKGIEMSFVTITMHEKWRGTDGSTKNWRANRDKLLARFRRAVKAKYGFQSDYVYISEYHQDGALHIHGVFTGNLKTRWWKDNARECGLGYMAKAERLTTALQAINYVLKYITKEIGKTVPIKNFRRINYSQGFPNLQTSILGGVWRIIERDESIESVIIDGIRKDLTVTFDGSRFASYDDL